MIIKSEQSIKFVRSSYGPRLLALGLGFVAIASALISLQAPWWVWLAPALHGFVWPHFAWRRTRNAADPAAAERCNLLVDHFAGGMWIAAIAFNTLPVVLILVVAGINSMAVGGLRPFLRGMMVQAAGVGAGLLVYGVQWQPVSSMREVLACLPLLVLYPLAMAYVTRSMMLKFRQQQRELAYQSQHDSLSGLYNRRHWDACVQAEFLRCQRTGEPAALVMIDFDHFKQINDMLGHLVGDEVIRRFAHRLRTCLRRTDTPGRYGGEEFCILLPHTTRHDAETLMHRLRKNLQEQPLIKQRAVTVSIGIAALTTDLSTHEAWVRLADQMLYRAKYQGRDCVVAAGVDYPVPEQAASTWQWGQQPDIRAEGHVLAGLESGDVGVALFDPSDQLIWANSVFLDLFLVAPEPRTFADIMHNCYQQQRGPRIECDDIAVWLAAADAKRRSKPNRSFIIDIHDGRYFQVEENSFENGWLLGLFIPYTP
ncbi:diguanylate cyclase [Alcaligenaceae bacterium]|nr:diguanylate cyclase [Alcaligenaceae bacterium]